MRMLMDMRDHILANFTDCQEMAEYADRIHSGPRSKAVSAISEATAVSAVDNWRRSLSLRVEQTVAGYPAARARAPTVAEMAARRRVPGGQSGPGSSSSSGESCP